MGAVLSEMERRSDKYRNLRLNIDHMTYEQLLELSDRIGYVSTGLKEDALACSLIRSRMRKPKKICTICQEAYKRGQDTGKLRSCGHLYHTDCIKKWLRQKNTCPLCKAPAAP